MLSKAQEEYYKESANKSVSINSNQEVKPRHPNQSLPEEVLVRQMSNMFNQTEQPSATTAIVNPQAQPKPIDMANLFAAAQNTNPAPIQQVRTLDEIEKQHQQRAFSPNVSQNGAKSK